MIFADQSEAGKAASAVERSARKTRRPLTSTLASYESPYVKIITSKSVKSFLENISPMNDIFKQCLLPNFIFRGQGNSKWKLTPSAFRKNTTLPCGEDIYHSPQATYRQQRKIEWYSLKTFVLELNKNGFHLPNENLLYKFIDSHASDEEYNSISRHEMPWPNSDYYSILALAQHYGLPTRLMDWTYNPLVAAFFAAKECVKLLKNNENVLSLSIFALNKNSAFLEDKSFVDATLKVTNSDASQTPRIIFHTVEPPTYFNNNLLHQKGLFICCTEYGNIKNSKFEPLTLNEYFDSKISRRENEMFNAFLGPLLENSLFEFRLSSKFASELLFELDKQFINEATLFPGISSCINSIYSRSKNIKPAKN